MSKISTYPIVTPTADDLLLGTNGSDGKTKNFTVAALVALAHGGGGGSDAYYRHVQASAAAVWVVQHNLGKRPNVSVVDSAGDLVNGDTHYDSDTQLTITFSAPFSGEAYAN